MVFGAGNQQVNILNAQLLLDAMADGLLLEGARPVGAGDFIKMVEIFTKNDKAYCDQQVYYVADWRGYTVQPECVKNGFSVSIITIKNNSMQCRMYGGR